jgi:hypothetical protein
MSAGGTCFGAHEPDAAVRACRIALRVRLTGCQDDRPGGNASALPVHKAIQVAQATPHPPPSLRCSKRPRPVAAGTRLFRPRWDIRVPDSLGCTGWIADWMLCYAKVCSAPTSVAHPIGPAPPERTLGREGLGTATGWKRGIPNLPGRRGTPFKSGHRRPEAPTLRLFQFCRW